MKRKMKRWLSLVLAMVLLCGALLVASAAETGTPLYEQLGFESADALMEGWTFGPVDYEWVTARYEVYLAELTADPDKAFEEGYSGWDWETVDEYYGSREEFLRDAAMQLVMMESFTYVPPVSVQLNGEKVNFPDAQPEMKNDRTMVPFRAIAEALGAVVDYDSGAVTAVKGGVRLDFTLGGDTLTLSDAQTGEVLDTAQLDAVPYEKDGRTYVPVRFFAEAFGLTVQWDDFQQTAVLYDRDALIAQIDEQFAVVNQWLAAQPVRDPAQTMRTVMALRVLYTQLNSIDGDETTALIDGTLEVVDGSGGMTMDIQMDLHGLLALLAGEYDQYGWEDEQSLTAQLAQWQDKLQNAQLELVWEAESDTLYLRCPLLMEALAETNGVSLPTDKWIAFENVWGELQGVESPLIESTLTADMSSVGALVVGIAEQNCTYVYSTLWDEVQQTADMVTAFAGDDCFTKSGTRYTTELSVPLPAEEGYASATYTLNMADGSIEGEAECRIRDGSSDMLATVTFAGDTQKGEAAVTVHVKNDSITEITMSWSQQQAPAGSEVQLPDAEQVITSDELETMLGI